MIRLIRADGVEILLNSDLIKSIEENEETDIILTNEEKIKVKNTKKDILLKIKAYKIGSSEERRDPEEKPPEKEREK